MIRFNHNEKTGQLTCDHCKIKKTFEVTMNLRTKTQVRRLFIQSGWRTMNNSGRLDLCANCYVKENKAEREKRNALCPECRSANWRYSHQVNETKNDDGVSVYYCADCSHTFSNGKRGGKYRAKK